MITNEILDVLNNERISKEEKMRFLERLDLQYSDFYKLSEIYKGSYIYSVINPFLYTYSDKSFSNVIDKQNRKISNNKKKKKMKQIWKRRKTDYEKY